MLKKCSIPSYPVPEVLPALTNWLSSLIMACHLKTEMLELIKKMKSLSIPVETTES